MGKESSCILVPLDGSNYSDRALDLAMDLARGLGERLVLLHVVQRPRYGLKGGSAWDLAWRSAKDDLVKFGNELLAKAEAKALKQRLKVAKIMRLGHVPDEISKLANAEKPRLIVMGTRGLGSTTGFLLGSVSNKVVHSTRFPVTLVR